MKNLAARYLDGIATEAEVAELSALLREDAGARTDYLRLVEVHSRLATDASFWTGQKAEAPPLSRAGIFRRSRIAIPLAAAASLALLALSLWQGKDKSEVPLATILKTENADWGGVPLADGARVNTGPLKLRGGVALLRLDGGVTLFLKGPVDLRLESGGRVSLLRGEVSAQVPEEASGFTIQTPGGEVVDLGTEFIARVDRDASTTVTVKDGEVEVYPRKDAAKSFHKLSTGEALRLDRKGVASGIVSAPTSHGMDETMRAWQGSSASGSLLLRESFDYAAGDHEPQTLNGGEGWGGPWSRLTTAEGAKTYSGTTRDMRVEVSGAGSSWVTPSGKNFRQRRLALPLDLTEDSVRYVSLRWREGDLPGNATDESGPPGEGPTSGLSLSFRRLEESSRERIGLRMDHLLRPRIETGTGQGFVSRVKAAPGGSLLLVAKILSRRSGEDEISVRVYGEEEIPGTWEPETWDVVSRGVRLDAALDHVVIQSGGPVPRQIEEIRMGTSWRDVAGRD